MPEYPHWSVPRPMPAVRLLVAGILLLSGSAASAAGDVTVAVQNGKLTITGDDASNQILITSDFNEEPEDFVTVFGQDGTTVNGAASAVAANVTGNTTIKLGDGGDELLIGETIDFPKNLTIDLGDGDDVLDLTDTRAVGKLAIKTGDGGDALTSSVVSAGAKLTIATGDGNDTYSAFDFIDTPKKASIKTGDGNDVVTLGCDTGGGFCVEVAARLSVNSGAGFDEIVVQDAIVSQTLDATLGSDDDTFSYRNSSFDGDVKANGGSGSNTASDLGGNTINGTFELKNFN